MDHMGDAHPFRERYPSVLRRLQRCMVFNQNSEDVQEDNRKAERVCAAPHDPEHAFHGCDIIEDGDRVQDFKAMAADPAAVQAQKSRTEHFGKLPGNQLLSEKRRTFTLRDCSFDTLRTPGQITELQGTQKKVDTGASSWLRRTVNTTFRRHKRPLNSTAIPQLTNKHCVSISSLCAPQLDMDTPNQSLNPPGGAAARAAAAAQNEILESARLLTMQDNLRLVQPKVSNDSESGIGIDLREPSDDMDLTLPIMRTDPSLILPEELLGHVMSFLDSDSLTMAELVSHRWYSTANSYHTWRAVFGREYGVQISSSLGKVSRSHVGGMGLGKRRPDQDWKEMWKVRKGLHKRWSMARAVAIYLEGHRDSVYCVQFDEDKILTGSRDRTVRVWDARTYRCLKVIGVVKDGNHGNLTPLEDPRFNPNPANRGNPPIVTLIPIRTTTDPIQTIIPSIYHDGSILCLQFDHEIMVTGSSDNTCIIWDIKDDYKAVRRLYHHSAGVLDVCFDEKHIVSCSKDTTICVWDRETGELRRTLVGHRGPVNAVQLRGDLVVSASGDGIAKLWNLTSGNCVKEFPSQSRGLACVEFSPDSRTILAGGNDQVIYQFDANSGELVKELKGHEGLVRSLHLDSANGRVISGSYDTSVKAYDLNTGDLLCDFKGWTTSWMLSAKADYRRIVATSQDSRAVIMDFGHFLPGIEILDG
ncbi:hypothetical protein MMC32_003105 [Xylographa parallela]|nr:hypothetical protein [Xylographa parallela]